MSEEQPTFKVTDRRLFNADGTPREVEHEEEPKAAETAAPENNVALNISAQGTSGAGVSATTAAAPPSQAESPVSDTRAPESSRADASPLRQPEDEIVEAAYDEEDIPGAHDPASFINFLMSIASNAAAALGMMEHPVTGQRGVDLPLAKHWIDVLGMLQQKTRGNLSAQEQQIFEGLLADLRVQYVSLTSAPRPSGPRGFTGRDIIGGK